jgi:hypothetical protein
MADTPDYEEEEEEEKNRHSRMSAQRDDGLTVETKELYAVAQREKRA